MKKIRFGLILGWICALLVSALQLFGAVMKFMPVVPGSEAEAMNAAMGMTPEITLWLAVLEIVTVVLFLIPRTSTVGFVLMVGYFGGVWATLITHGMAADGTPMALIIFLLLTVSAYFRNPELLSRLKGRA